MITRIIIVTILALAGSLAPAATATDNVTVVAEFGAGTYLAQGAPCPVTVSAGADGGAVLDAAVQAGCIDSWTYREYSSGRFVTCIQAVCGIDNAGQIDPALQDQDGTYWELSVNAHVTDYGIDQYAAHDLDVVRFTYTDWWAGFADYTASSTLP